VIEHKLPTLDPDSLKTTTIRARDLTAPPITRARNRAEDARKARQ
jgi:hypothetical protein